MPVATRTEMKTIFKYGLVIFAFLALCKISPLGAAVAVLTCLVRAMFRSHVVSHAVALLLHDFLAWVFRGFKPTRVRTEPYRPKPSPFYRR